MHAVLSDVVRRNSQSLTQTLCIEDLGSTIIFGIIVRFAFSFLLARGMRVAKPKLEIKTFFLFLFWMISSM